jgi:hypothetical protein
MQYVKESAEIETGVKENEVGVRAQPVTPLYSPIFTQRKSRFNKSGKQNG